MERIKGWIKSKRIWSVIGVLVLMIVIYSVADNGAKIALGKEKVNHDTLTTKVQELDDQIEEKESQIKEVEAKIIEEEEKLSSKQTEVEEAFALVDNKDTLTEEVLDLDKNIKTKQSEVEGLDNDIATKQDELSTLEGEIVKASGEPLSIHSGQYVVGHDIPEGRYQASGSSNFVVRNSSGILMVNTILGYDHGDGDYVFFASEGDIVETSSPTTLTPVE